MTEKIEVAVYGGGVARLSEELQSRKNKAKQRVCEYLLKVNENMDGAFIPPTAIDWLGNGIVTAIFEEKE